MQAGIELRIAASAIKQCARIAEQMLNDGDQLRFGHGGRAELAVIAAPFVALLAIASALPRPVERSATYSIVWPLPITRPWASRP